MNRKQEQGSELSNRKMDLYDDTGNNVGHSNVVESVKMTENDLLDCAVKECKINSNSYQEIAVTRENGHATNSVHVIIHQGPEDVAFTDNVEGADSSDVEVVDYDYQDDEINNADRLKKVLSYEMGRDVEVLQECSDAIDQSNDIIGIEDVEGIDVICGNCGKHFHSLSTLSSHLSTHDNSVFSSRTTNIEVIRDEESSREKMSVENRDTSPKKQPSAEKLHCNICSKVFLSKRLLMRHSKICDAVPPDFSDGNSCPSVLTKSKVPCISLKDTTVSSLTCNYCKKIFSDSSSLQAHVQKQHTIECEKNGDKNDDEFGDISDISIDDEELVENKKNPSRRGILKVMMGRKSPRESHKSKVKSQNIEQDVRSPSGSDDEDAQESLSSIKARTCKYCGKILSRPSNMRKHVRKMHENPIKNEQLDHSETEQRAGAEIIPLTQQNTNRERNIKATITPTMLLKDKRHVVNQKPTAKKVLMQKDIKQENNHETVVVITNNSVALSSEVNKRVVQCPECSRILSSQHSLMEHMRTHTGEKPFQCEKCGRPFSTPRNLKKHMISVHSGTKAYKCNDCGKDFALKSSLKAHSKFHTGTFRYCCAACGKGFQTPASLRRHEIIHTGDRPYPCEQCGKRFNDTSALKKHTFFHTGLKPYICGKCGSAFATPSSLRYHDLVHTGVSAFQCHECGKSYRTNSSLQRHQRIHSGAKPFQCDFCEQGFAERWQLVAHHREHTGERPYECSFCEKTFVSLRKLTRHAHIHNPSHLCTLCGKSFTTSSFLKTHMYKHTGKHPHHCENCPKRFATRSALKRHEVTHLGIKPYICDFCGKCFTSGIGLKNHTTLHTGDRPHICETCGKGFPNKTALRIHSQFHNTEKQFQCDMCSRRFHRVYELNHHRLIHSDEKSFKCDQCDKSYHHRSAFLAHVNTHTEEKWYPCNECEKSFLREATLRKHKKIHAAVKPHPCDECGKRFVRKEHLKRHLSTHSGVIAKVEMAVVDEVIAFDDHLDSDNIMNLEETTMVAEHVEMDLQETD